MGKGQGISNEGEALECPYILDNYRIGDLTHRIERLERFVLGVLLFSTLTLLGVIFSIIALPGTRANQGYQVQVK